MSDVKTNLATKARGRPRAFDQQQALERAMEVFWAAGYEAASIALLGEAMGISAQSLYAAFESKEQLYRRAIDHYQRTVGGFVVRALNEESDAIDAIGRLLRDAATTFSRTAATPGCMITTAPGGPSEAPLAVLGRELRAGSVQLVSDRLARGMRDGQVRADADCAMWARYVASVVQGLSVQARDGVPVDALLATAAIAAHSLKRIRP